jgi:hypothetical protein
VQHWFPTYLYLFCFGVNEVAFGIEVQRPTSVVKLMAMMSAANGRYTIARGGKVPEQAMA